MAANNDDLTETLVFQNQTIIDLLQEIKSLLEQSVQESEEMNSTLNGIESNTGDVGSVASDLSNISLAVSTIEKELEGFNSESFVEAVTGELNAISAGIEIIGFK